MNSGLARLFFGRLANLQRSRREQRRFSRRSPQFQRLEPRLLLSADLIGTVEFDPGAAPLFPGADAEAVVVVENIGDTTAKSAKVSVYASADDVLDASDVLLGKKKVHGKLKPGESQEVGVDLGFDTSLLPDDYRLIALVDSGDKVHESNEANNVALGPIFDFAWQFDDKFTFTDEDGTKVKLRLNGPGIGEVIWDGSGWDLLVSGTDETSVLRIQTNGRGDGRVEFDDIHIAGPLKALLAPRMDLTGTLAMEGALGAGMLIGSATDATIAVPTIEGIGFFGMGAQGIAVLGDVENTQILIGANFGADGQVGGEGEDADTYGAGELGTLLIKGAMLSSQVRVGQDPVDGIYDNGNDDFLGGTESSIDAIVILDEMSDDSLVVAGSLPFKAFIDGHKVRLADDPRFRLHGEEGPNQAPEAADDLAITDEEQAVTVDVLANDVDPDGDPLTVQQVGAAANGTVVLNADNTVTYTPDPNFFGADSFSYTIDDGAGGSDTATVFVTVNPVNDPPVAVEDAVSTDEDTPVIVDVLANDIDVDGDPLSLFKVSLPQFGSVSPNPDGTIRYEPDPNFFGTDSFGYSISDGNGEFSNTTVTVTVNPVNDAPVLDPISDRFVVQGGTLELTATASDVDDPAEDLTFSLDAAPAGAMIDPDTGEFSWTPAAPGRYEVTVRVTDDGGLDDFETFTVNVFGLPEVSIGNVTVEEGDVGETPAQFLVTLSVPAPVDVSVDYFTLNGTAFSNEDYVDVPRATLQIAAGEMSGTITVTIKGDRLVEPDETFQVWLTSPVNATLGAAFIGTGTIETDDFAPVAEDDFFMTDEDVALVIDWLDLVANDFDPDEDVLTIDSVTDPANGRLVNNFDGSYTYTPDLNFNGDDSFTYTATDRLGGFSTATVFITVNAVNDPPALGPIPDMGALSGQPFSYRATASDVDDALEALVFTLTTAPASMTIAADGLIEWTPTDLDFGTSSITVRVTDDDGLFGEESFDLTVVAPPRIAIDDVTVVEGDSGTQDALFRVMLSGPAPVPISVGYRPSAAFATAQAPGDYTAVTGTLVFAPGETEQFFAVPIVGDTTTEPDEFFNYELHDATQGADIVKGTAVGTILDNAPIPRVVIDDVTVLEGDVAVFEVSLTAPYGLTVGVAYGMADGTATAGSDFTASGGVLLFNPGTTVQTITVPVAADADTAEGDETFIVRLTSATNAILVPPAGSEFVEATGRIVDVDGTSINMVIDDVTIVESDGGTSDAVFTVSLTGGSADAITVDFETVDDTALAGVDYVSTSGTLTFDPGSTTQTITVQVLGDTAVEPDKTFFVSLSNATNLPGSLDASATGRIVDNEALPRVAIDPETVFEGDDPAVRTEATFRVLLTAPSTVPVIVDYATFGGSASAGVDYVTTSGQITFDPGETEQAIVVQIVGDTAADTGIVETFSVRLTNPQNATISLRPLEPNAFIVDEDAPGLLVAASLGDGFDGSAPDAAQLEATLDAAVMLWTQTLGAGDQRLAQLEGLGIALTDFSGTGLGATDGGTILIDTDAAGHGWFVDLSPARNSEFRLWQDSSVLAATPRSEAFGRMDLLTVVMHEIGHVLGFDHDDAAQYAVMGDELEAGTRYTLSAGRPAALIAWDAWQDGWAPSHAPRHFGHAFADFLIRR